MAYAGKFLVNNEPLSPLTISGIGTFDAYSGNNQYRNRGGCTAVPDKGPIPAGKYWIVARPAGGVGSRALAWMKDAFS
ncbi:tlde1 domain-containing protein, partial [Paraburkholderia sp. BR14427]|uniref:tlde1 domain-containing protein n=1 Tax=Paraburkholderia sp. BR14427 TaxID=3237008 RepID=UPI0034CE18E8